MTMKNRLLAVIGIAILWGHGPAQAQEQAKVAQWKEDQAYTLGIQAYQFSFPWLYLTKLRFAWMVLPPKNPTSPRMAYNQWWHARDIITSDYRDGGAPNNDNLYSVAWLDVNTEPVILSHGDVVDRFFTFQIASFTSDNFAYVGLRTTGPKAGHFAITGPNWKGTLPEGVTRLEASPTGHVLIFGRTALKGAADLPAARAVQDTYALTPLSQWGKAGAVVPEDRKAPAPFDPRTDPLADWRTINRAMAEDPPLAQHAALLAMFGTIGVGPGLDVDALDEATKRGLARAAKDGMARMEAILTTGGGIPKVNGWSVPPPTMGRAMINNDLNTLVLQCLGGILSHDPAEAMYFNTHADKEGLPLTGANAYTLHFAPGALPDVRYFWSLTLYDLTNNLVKNPIDRWAIGSLGKPYTLDKDGGLTLYIQHTSPGKGKESNWLPAPEGEFWLVFRTYGPGPSLIDGSWHMPALEALK
jgi:hypothetical protein